MPSKTAKSCLVISYGPVPTPQYPVVEGGGLRAWGLAQGLKAHGIDTTVAINAAFPQELSFHQGIKLVNWAPDGDFVNLINAYDSLIVSYCMGSDSVFIADNLNDDVQLILDVYVPIYVEVSARESNDIDNEYSHYMADVSRYNHVLKRGDYFLCASETQKLFYIGVLSSLGIINPRSYRQNRIIVAPFGISSESAKPTRNPYQKFGVKDDDFLVLWFGGLYPWFRVDEYLEAVKELSNNSKIKFAIVGGKNPFNPNPDFSKQYERAHRFAEANKLLGSSLLFIDWVDFDDRINWYSRADIVISINQPGDENHLAWRTRVMDFVWGDLPILTNGGDPLSEDLLANKAAIRLESLSKKSMVAAIKDLAANKNKLAATKKSVAKVKDRYLWENIMEPISKIIVSDKTPSPDEQSYRKNLGVLEPTYDTMFLSPPARGKITRYTRLSRKAFSYARRKGLKRSAHLAFRIGRTQLERRTRPRTDKKYVFISHPIDNTGAPLVLLQMVKEFADKFGAKKIRLIAPGILPHQLKDLREHGIRVDKAAIGLSDRLIDLQLGINENDFVLINTLAVYPNYRGYILRALASGRISQAYWFIHEDTPQIPIVARDLADKKEYTKITNLANNGKLQLLVPSKRIKDDYQKLWGVKKIKTVHLRVDVPQKLQKIRSASEYNKIDFLLAGTPADGRKGQLIAISAFYYFLKNYFEKSPKSYRDFTLSLVGIGDDYLSQHVKIIGNSLLGKKIRIYPSVALNESLKIIHQCNAAVCCSLNETFGLYVAEGMFMGHLILRNNSAGVDEQLRDSVNGYLVDHTDVSQFASRIEKVLSKKKNSNQNLQQMGHASQKIIAKYGHNSYVSQILN